MSVEYHIGRIIDTTGILLADKTPQMPQNTHIRYRHRPRTKRRSEHRLLCSDLVRLRWTAGKRRREEVAILEDLSASRANLFMGVLVEEGARVALCKGETEFRGIVRHSRIERNGYFVEVEFEEGSQWKGEAEFIPDHLLDISRLRF